MKTEKNILVAFLLNLFFSIFELVGGVITGSVAILSDAIHDVGDAASIGAAFFLEKKSRRAPDETHTYGYLRYSVIGSVLTTLILLVGSALVIYNAVLRIIDPVPIDYTGMIVFAVVGVAVNFIAAWFTRDGESMNQRAVNLHMLEDVLGWAVVLIGAIVMRFTDFSLLDPILSILVAAFIFLNALRSLREAIDLFLAKTPAGIRIHKVIEETEALPEVLGVHHVHVWSMDGERHYATMHVVTEGDPHDVKAEVREVLDKLGIHHVTLEIERKDECCPMPECSVEERSGDHHGYHHHHHHHGHHHGHHQHEDHHREDHQQ